MRPPLTPVVKQLLIINVVVFVLMYLPGYMGLNTENLFGGLNLKAFNNGLALYYPTSENFRPFQLVSHFFVHGGFMHLAFNMFGLFIFGPLLERRFGSRRFLLLYLVAAAGAVALHFGFTYYQVQHYQGLLANFEAQPTIETFDRFWRSVDVKSLAMDGGGRLSKVVADLQTDLVLRNVDPDMTLRRSIGIMEEYVEFLPNIPVVGASGAIYGVVAAFTICYPNTPLMLIFLPIPIKARIFVPVLLVIEVFLGVMQFSWDPIAHWAHIGGALLGGLLAYIWYRRDPPAGASRWDGGVPR